MLLTIGMVAPALLSADVVTDWNRLTAAKECQNGFLQKRKHVGRKCEMLVTL
jgi:hypothetical protein